MNNPDGSQHAILQLLQAPEPGLKIDDSTITVLKSVVIAPGPKRHAVEGG